MIVANGVGESLIRRLYGLSISMQRLRLPLLDHTLLRLNGVVVWAWIHSYRSISLLRGRFDFVCVLIFIVSGVADADHMLIIGLFDDVARFLLCHLIELGHA